VGSEEEESEKKSFSIRGINAQTDTGLCVHYICDTYDRVIPFRYGGSENANTRVSVYLYCVIIARLCVFPTTAKTLSLILVCPFPLYLYIITPIFIHVADGFMFFDTVNSRAHTARAYNIRGTYMCVFSSTKY